MASDPGPLVERLQGETARSDSENSLATENSDEEALEGDSKDHVERMLSRLLDPDERTIVSEDEEGDSEDDLDAMYGALNEADDETDAPAGSDAEDDAEEVALKLHIYALKQGIQEFDAWSQECFAEVEAEGSRPSAARSDAIGRAAASGSQSAKTAAVARELQNQVSSLRSLHNQVKLLVLNQQAICAHYTQNLLRVSHAQAELAMRRHGESQRRHKQLRIVRRESARLCRSLEQCSLLRTRVDGGTSGSSSSGSTLSGVGTADVPGWHELAPPPRAGTKAGPHKRQIGAQHKAVMMSQPVPRRTADVPSVSCRASTASDDDSAGKGADGGAAALLDAISRGARATDAVQGGDAVSASRHAELVRLVHRSCGVAARKLDKRPRGQSDRMVQAYSPSRTAESARGQAEGHGRALRSPAVQAAIAEALWQVVSAEQQQQSA